MVSVSFKKKFSNVVSILNHALQTILEQYIAFLPKYILLLQQIN